MTAHKIPAAPQKTLEERTECDLESEEAERPWPHIQSMFTLQAMKKNSSCAVKHFCLNMLTSQSTRTPLRT